MFTKKFSFTELIHSCSVELQISAGSMHCARWGQRCLVLAFLAVIVELASSFALVAVPLHQQTRAAAPAMMGNNAPDGPFTPIVKLSKVLLGEKTLNKVCPGTQRAWWRARGRAASRSARSRALLFLGMAARPEDSL